MKLLEIDLEPLCVRVNGKVVRFGGLQMRLLELLWRNRDHILTRNQILNEIWGNAPDVGPKAVDVQVCRLRQRLKDAGGEAVAALLEAVRLYGYVLKADGQPSDHQQPRAPSVPRQTKKPRQIETRQRHKK